MFAVDTNVLLYAAIQEFPEHKKAASLIKRWIRRNESWGITWNIAYEFLRVSTHAGVFEKPLRLQQSWDFLQDVIQGANCTVLNETKEHRRFLSELTRQYPRVSANLVHDFHTCVILYEHGIRTIYTADSDFLQFSFLETIDPVH